MIRSRPAHPRSRGENGGRSIMVCPPPGLIPAHAGKTHALSRGGAMPWAHPRSRGENARQSEGPALRSGSSPLTRGKQPGDGGVLAGPRLIPAHAGKTTAATGPGGSCTAHPRSRGENCATALNLRSSPGSSPLTRGKQRSLASSTGAVTAYPRSRGENGQ